MRHLLRRLVPKMYFSGGKTWLQRGSILGSSSGLSRTNEPEEGYQRNFTYLRTLPDSVIVLTNFGKVYGNV
jgi:hypothetical protein